MSDPAAPPSAWYLDPNGAPEERWWNGLAWTATTRPVPAPTRPLAPPPGAVIPAIPAAPLPIAQPYGTAVQPYSLPPVGWWRSPVDNRPVVHGMGDALRVLFAKYATFDGRASRSEYWYFTLFNVLVGLGVSALFLLGTFFPPLLWLGVIVYFGLIAWSLVVLVPSLALTVRRLRDAGLPWGWLFITFAPLGSIVLIVMVATPSKFPHR